MGWRRKFELGLKNWSSGISNWRRPEPGWPKRSSTLSAAKLIRLKRRDSATLEVGTGTLAPGKSSGRKSPLRSLVLIQKKPKPRIHCISSVSIRKIAPGLRRFAGQLLERKGILKFSIGSFFLEA